MVRPNTHPRGWKTALENLRNPSFTLHALSIVNIPPETA
jgi:hypothetical protein